jgi:hypothetical protein
LRLLSPRCSGNALEPNVVAVNTTLYGIFVLIRGSFLVRVENG